MQFIEQLMSVNILEEIGTTGEGFGGWTRDTYREHQVNEKHLGKAKYCAQEKIQS